MSGASTAADLMDAAQDAKVCNETSYFSHLRETFGRHEHLTTRLYGFVVALPFKCYLTVNFDPLLALAARTAQFECETIWSYPDLDPRKLAIHRSIHYLHGYIDQDNHPSDGNIVLSRTEFETAYRPGGALLNTLIPVLENDPVVFIGCRLRDEYMQRAIGLRQEKRRERQKAMLQRGARLEPPPPSYIFLPKETVRRPNGSIDDDATDRNRANEEAELRNMEITPVWYSPDDNHAELANALERLAGIQRPERGSLWQGPANGN